MVAVDQNCSAEQSRDYCKKRTRPVASRSVGRGKEVEDCCLWKYATKKRVFNYLQAINDEAFPLSPSVKFTAFHAQFSNVQFLATCCPACVSHGQSIIFNWGEWRPCDLSQTRPIVRSCPTIGKAVLKCPQHGNADG